MSHHDVRESKVRKAKPLTCVVVSDKMKLSRVGKMVRLVKHNEFGKYIKLSTTIMFHDPEEKSKLGDTVLVDASKPFSARKRHQLVEVVKVASTSLNDDIV